MMSKWLIAAATAAAAPSSLQSCLIFGLVEMR